MRTKRTTRRGIPARGLGAAAAAVGLLAVAAFSPNAAGQPRGTADATPSVAARIAQSLGTAATAGSYYDPAAQATVVNVTSDAAADAVRSAGAVPRHVSYSTDQLNAAADAIRSLNIAGTAWADVPQRNQVVVAADSGVDTAALTRLSGTAGRYGKAVAVERLSGRLRTLVGGGDSIYGGQYRCSVGFNVHDGNTSYLLTAGHCGQVVSSWYTDSAQSTAIGPTVSYTFPGSDYALVRYDNTALPHPSTVGDQSITDAADAYVGEQVERRGSTTGVHGGTVTALDASANYGDGDIVTGLIQTDVCAEPGDSGGSLYAGSSALGLTSGGNGDCTSGGTTYFQPVTAALNHYGVSVG